MRKFLVIQTAFFGDVILATGLVETLAHSFENVQIDVLVRKGREGLLKNNPHINRIYLLDKSKKMKSVIDNIKQIRKMGYDHVVNIHRHGTSGIITALSGAKERIGFDVHPMSFAFNKVIGHTKQGKHEVEKNHELVKHIVGDFMKRPRLYPSKADYERVKHDRPYVTISPATVWYTKQWPTDKWIELINRFDSSIDVILLGGPGDKDLCDLIESSVRRKIINKAGVLSFLPSAALMEHAIMNYTNDSAPLHIASAMDAPVSAIFCSTAPIYGYGPLSQDSRVYEYDGEPLRCRPCGVHGHSTCPEGHFKCSNIDAKSVFEDSMSNRDLT